MHPSFSGKVWRPRASVAPVHHQLAQTFGLEPLFATILADRGLNDQAAVDSFLQPRLQHLADPLGLLDMDQAVARLIKAMENQETIAVFGDYDVDGATSTALLVRYFRDLGIAIRVYIPNRLTEGYGLNSQALLSLAAEGVKLVITVDCGVTAIEALTTAQQAGLEVIVTDHHLVGTTLPPALAIINPNRPDDPFPHKELAGVGVAFFLVMALNRALRQHGWFQAGRTEPDLKRVLDLVAIGTIADVAGLVNMNRILVAYGLRVAGDTDNAGLRALQTQARLSGTLRAGQVAFQLGPRINAGGRLSQGTLGVELLTTTDVVQAETIAATLEKYNRERQELEEKILRAALAAIAAAGGEQNRFGLVVASEEWHPGVIGIVASRIAEKLYRPTIVIALDGAGRGKGSGRSIPGVHLLTAIEATSDLLLGFGGHRAAAGLSLEANQVPAFAAAFDAAVRKQATPDLFKPTVRIDGVLTIPAISRELVARLERLQPFGQGNPEPVVVLHNVRVVDARILKDRHVKCRLADLQNHTLEAIAFQVLPGALGAGLLSSIMRVDCVGTLATNSYGNRETVQMIIKDARPAEVQ